MERNIWEVISKGFKRLQKEFKAGHHISERGTLKQQLHIIIIRQKR